MYSCYVTQAHLGCDFDFPAGNARKAEAEIHRHSRRVPKFGPD